MEYVKAAWSMQAPQSYWHLLAMVFLVANFKEVKDLKETFLSHISSKCMPMRCCILPAVRKLPLSSERRRQLLEVGLDWRQV